MNEHKEIREVLKLIKPHPFRNILSEDRFVSVGEKQLFDWLRQLLDENHVLKQEKQLTLEQLENGGMRASGDPAMLFYKMVVELFEQNGGKNFLTLTIGKPDKSKRYSVTIQNLNGELSPAEKMEAQAKEIEELKGRLQRYEDD